MPRTVRFEATTPGGKTIRIVQGDLTQEPVDAIVNPANEHLAHGGGAAGAIAKAGGPAIQQESDDWIRRHGPLPAGGVALTGAGDLACRHLIHAVGPVFGSGDEDRKLERAVRNSLDLAAAQGCESISLPAISSGIFGFPKDRCAKVILDALERFDRERPDVSLREINVCNIDEHTSAIFEREARSRFGD